MLSTSWEQRQKSYDFMVWVRLRRGDYDGGIMTAALNPKPTLCQNKS